MQVKQKIENLTNNQKFLITVSVLDEQTKQINTSIHLNKFLTGDIPITSNEIGRLLNETYKEQTTVKDRSVIEQERSDLNVKSFLE